MMYIMLLAISMIANAQDIEPNLKWGKPTDQELQMTEYALDKEADAVVLYHKTDVSYQFTNNDFRVIYRVNTRLKVLKPEGKRVADGQIAYLENETNRTRREIVTGLKATAYNMEDGKLVKTKMERSMTSEERLDKNQMVMKFSVPQVKVGTVIEIEYRIDSDYYGNIRDWYAQRDIPVLYTCYELSIPEWFTFNIEETGMNHMEKKENSEPMTLLFSGGTENILTNIKTFVGRNLPALKDDDFVWHAADYGDKVTAELAGIFIPGSVYKSYTSTWDDIDNQLLSDEDFGGRLKRNSPLKDEIIAAGIPDISDKKERIAAVWKLLKSKVRWNGDYAFWGKSASKILKEGTGTNADINFLLINMLQDAGIESTPVVMRTRDSGILPLSHSSLKYLNTFVVGIPMTDSGMAYLDGSAEDGYLNVLPAKLLVTRARVVQKTGADLWVNLQANARGRETAIVQAQLSTDGQLKGQKSTMLVEEAAAAKRRVWRLAKDSTELIQKMQERDGIEIQSYRLEGRHDFSPTVKEEMTFTKQCDVAGDMIYLNPLVFIPQHESPFTTAERILPIEFPYNQSETQNVIITLPEGYVVEEAPKPIIIKFDGATARIICNVNGNQLSVQYQMNISQTFYASTQYQDLKAFFDSVVESNKHILTIKKAQ
ncbi:MAG: DUF3857 domain-containing protein [Prevotella sp.]|nr:DUF3857 domain-containing protein [Prevotella sp.]